MSARKNDSISKYFIFTSLSRKYDGKLDPNKTKLFFVLSLGIMGIIAGIRGTLYSAFNRVDYEWVEWREEYVWKDLTFNPVITLESGFLEIGYFLILLLVYLYVSAGTKLERTNIFHDIALISQASIIKDILFISYALPYYLFFPPNGWGWRMNVLNLYNVGLYWMFVVFLIVFFLPRIMTRLLPSYPDYNSRLGMAILISFVIFVMTALLHSIIKILIDLPLGLT